MIEAMGSGKLVELKQRLLFVLLAMLVFRVGSFIPVPGIDPTALAALFEQQRGTILDMFNMFSGGALERLSLFALGVMPYISASIIMQLLSAVVPKLEQLKKEGESGRRKITQYTRYGTLVLATFQSIGVAIALQSQQVGNLPVVPAPGIAFVFTAVVSLVTGTLFLMWLGEQVTERGIGNGISLIIFAGIVAGMPAAIGGTLELARIGELSPFFVIVLMLLAVLVTGFVVFMERGQRRITVNYAKRQQGGKVYAAQKSHLPLKVNMAGVIPPIFASSIILFPATLGGWFGSSEGMGWLKDIASTLSPGQPVYVLLYALAIVFFCFFYTALMFNPKDTADNLKRSGAFIPGIRPGQHTANYIDSVMSRLTLVGAVYITAVCLLPELLIVNWNVPFYFGGTSLLIIVVVVMDFISQIQAHLMSHQYEGLMKKANLKGYGRSGL
jgi:preprotein translocase subunit SecY